MLTRRKFPELLEHPAARAATSGTRKPRIRMRIPSGNLSGNSGCNPSPPSGDAKQSQSVTFDDSSQRFAGNDRHIGSLRKLVDAVKRFDAFSDGSVRKVASEQKFFDHL